MAQDSDRIQNARCWSSFLPRWQMPLLSCGARTYCRAKKGVRAPQAPEQPCQMSLTEQGEVSCTFYTCPSIPPRKEGSRPEAGTENSGQPDPVTSLTLSQLAGELFPFYFY